MALRIRNASSSEVALILDWAAREGWNPGLQDALPFLVADPEGFWIGFEKERPVGAISGVRYGVNYAFLGLFLVTPEDRGRGLGTQLWNHVLTRLGDRILGLDGVVPKQPSYRRSGFELAYRNFRYTGVHPHPERSQRLSDLSSVPLSDLLAFDREVFGFERAPFVASWISMTESVGRVWLEGDRVRGYGLVRPCVTGARIGPLFADSVEVAESLLSDLCAARVGGTISLDVPEANPAAVRLAEGLGLSRTFETARMYRGGMPNIPVERVFGVSTLELG